MRKWKCLICKYIHEGDAPPEKCPVCKAPAAKFAAGEPETPAGDAAAAKGAPAEAAAAKQPGGLFGIIAGLMTRHHVHPISVHFPNGILPVALFMFVLARVFDASTLATAGIYNIFFVMLALPLVIFTGLLDWERKYNKALTVMFQIKILAAAATFVTCLVSLIWYLADPGVIGSDRGWLFILLNVVMVASAGVAGHIGGKLVFKE